MSDVTFGTAGLQDIPVSQLKEMLQDVKGRTHSTYEAEYGFNADTGALTFHFFPAGYAASLTTEWPDWTAFRDRLEQAVMATLDVSGIDAGYVPELKSFYVITPRPAVLNVAGFIERFFSALEQ